MSALKSLLLLVAFTATSVFAQSVTLSAAITFPDGLPGAGGITYSQRPAIYTTDPREPAFKIESGVVKLKSGVRLEFNGQLCAPTSDQTVAAPSSPTPGTDYRIAVKADCSAQAYSYTDTLPSGAVVFGGYHQLIGSPATGLSSGGGWTSTNLSWSIWDLNFRPSCEPRGMSRIGRAGFWVDIYFHGDGSNADGITRNNDLILTGSNPPVIPVDYGGNGTTKYSTFNWWEANEYLRQWGKRLPAYEELVLAAFGTNEGAGRGNHPVKTGFATYNSATSSSDPNFTSKWGLIQVTGVLWHWTSTFSAWQGTPTSNAWGWEAYNNTGGRGKSIMQTDRNATVLLFGASNVYTASGSPTGATAVAGSRALETIETPWDNSSNIAIRGVCTHISR